MIYGYVVACKWENTDDKLIPVPAKNQEEVIHHFLLRRDRQLSEAVYFNFYKYEDFNIGKDK